MSFTLRIPLFVLLTVPGIAAPMKSAPSEPAYLDPSQPVDVRARDLVARLTLEEKASLMENTSPGVPRLGIPRYNWWNEALHGVARAGYATVFPQAIGLAATWDDGLLHQVADAIGTEARAKHHEAVRNGKFLQYYGLTFWSPNINIFRDPRWGRGQETYGEDPFLTSRMGVAFVRGLQGDDPTYLKAAACAKHFAVHSGPERIRREMDNRPDAIDFHDTYLPAFEALVREAHVAGVMTAYNSVYGHPCTVNPILYDLLKEWGFHGYVVSDCGAVYDLFHGYKVADDAAEAEAMAVKLGLCVTCGHEAPALADAVKRGLIDEKTIDDRLSRLMQILFRLGMFDPQGKVPYAAIPFSENESPAHTELALDAARKSIVLLKNDGILPLKVGAEGPGRIRRVAVIGPNADSVPALLGNYNGIPRKPVTILDGLRTAFGTGVEIEAVKGCGLIEASPGAKENDETSVSEPSQGFDAAVAAAKRADLVIYVGGLSAEVEGEAANDGFVDFDGRDRTRIELPPPQEKLLEALHATGRPVVFVLMGGSCISVPWAQDHVSAIVEAWYPGEQGGTAVADVLTGKVNPGGRLPITFYRSTADLPDYADYNMANRTYRYFKGTPLYPFGFGLSYTTFAYGAAAVGPTGLSRRSEAKTEGRAPPSGGASADLQVSVEVTNTGKAAGDEVVQVYAQAPAASHPRDKESLCGFRRVHLAAGETRTVAIDVTATALRRWDEHAGAYAVPAGRWTFLVGASSADIRQSVAREIPAGFLEANP
jgi:beta-glucosidase